MLQEEAMNKNFKANERELVKVATYFKKQSRKLIEEGRLGEEHQSVEQAVDRFIEHLEQHADSRASIVEQRQYLKSLVKDNARCPQCHSSEMLKLTGTEQNEKGWKSNRYKCRKCNIYFTWNMPNNPWDMIEYLQEVLVTLSLKFSNPGTPEDDKSAAHAAIQSMQGNLEKLKPVIEAHDKAFQELQARDEEMDRLVHEFKNSLLIEKIKMDTWKKS